MAKAGLNIIPCTDDWHIHNTTSANCYRVMVEDFGFDLTSLRHMLISSIEASWAPEDLKKCWLTEWPLAFDSLRSRLSEQPAIAETQLIKYRR
jgi:adenosine deaminase